MRLEKRATGIRIPKRKNSLNGGSDFESELLGTLPTVENFEKFIAVYNTEEKEEQGESLLTEPTPTFQNEDLIRKDPTNENDSVKEQLSYSELSV